MNTSTLPLMIKTADHLMRPLPNLLDSALALARSAPCPPPYTAAIRKAAIDARNLWLHLGNVITLFELDAEPPPG